MLLCAGIIANWHGVAETVQAGNPQPTAAIVEQGARPAPVALIDKARIKEVIVFDGYSAEQADEWLRRYDGYDDRLYESINAYVQDRSIVSNVNVQGVTLNVLIERRKYTFWEAVDWMDRTMEFPGLATLLRLPLLETQPKYPISRNVPEHGKTGSKMLKFDKEQIKTLLRQENPKRTDIEVTVEGLSRVDGRLQAVLDEYLTKKTVSDDFQVGGMTMPLIMTYGKTGLLDALFLMNYYLENPKKAYEMRKMLDEDPGYLRWSCSIR